MARAFPFLPDTFGFELSVLETPGIEDPLAAADPADGPALAEAILSVAPIQAGFDGGESHAPSGLVFGPEPAEEGVSTLDFMAGLATFSFDSFAEMGPSSPAMENATEAFASHAIVDFASAASEVAPEGPADSASVDAASAAKGGTPGPGGGGGGDGDSAVRTDYLSGWEDGNLTYDIWIQFKGSGWTQPLQQAFINAADYFTDVITKDIGGGGRIGKVFVDDLYVTAEVRAIDGEGGILGQAGPTNVWTASELTAAGKMQFDVADALTYHSSGLWDDIVTHELMHVLGFGSLWNYGVNPLVSNYRYTGQQALNAYKETDPTATFIPVENEGGSGTAGAHWDEQELTNELMTGYINNSNELSKFSVMSLADLGYAVTNYYDFLV